MNRITPTDSKEARLKQALAAGEFVGYENLSASDREQIDRLLYVDDLTETQWKKGRERIWEEKFRHMQDIAVNLGHKRTELYKHDVLDAVMKVRGEEYGEELKLVAEKKTAAARRVSGRFVEYAKGRSGKNFQSFVPPIQAGIDAESNGRKLVDIMPEIGTLMGYL